MDDWTIVRLVSSSFRATKGTLVIVRASSVAIASSLAAAALYRLPSKHLPYARAENLLDLTLIIAQLTSSMNSKQPFKWRFKFLELPHNSRGWMRSFCTVSNQPLDGIILGAVSGLGFTLIETLGYYVPNEIEMGTTYYNAAMGQLSGLQLLIPRMLASVFSHLAYSSYFGYYIGLSNLKPKRRCKFLGIGYFVAASTHALWNSFAGLDDLALLVLPGILGYCLLMSAIIKARQLSPDR